MAQYIMVEVSPGIRYIALMATTMTVSLALVSAATGLSEQLLRLLVRSLQYYWSSFVASECKERSVCYTKFNKCNKIQHISRINLLFYSLLKSSNPSCNLLNSSSPSCNNKNTSSSSNSKMSLSASSSSSSWSISSRWASSHRCTLSRWWEWASSHRFTRLTVNQEWTWRILNHNMQMA